MSKNIESRGKSIPPRLAKRISNQKPRKGLFQPANVVIGAFLAILWLGTIYMTSIGFELFPSSVSGGVDFEILSEEPVSGVDVTINGSIWEEGGWTPSDINLSANTSYVFEIFSFDTIHGWTIKGTNLKTGNIGRGQSVFISITFETPGTYTFICTVVCSGEHDQMTGTINVT